MSNEKRRRYWIGTGTRLADDGTVNEVGVEVDADNITIEPSGALTVWLKDGPHRSRLTMAFAPNNWTKCHAVVES